MFLHNQGTTQPSIWRLYAAILCQKLLLENGVAADVVVSDAGTLSESVVVTTPAELQEAVRSGLRHVIINDHLDLTQAPRFSETTVLDSSVLAVGQTRSGQYTASIQVRPPGYPLIQSRPSFRSRTTPRPPTPLALPSPSCVSG